MADQNDRTGQLIRQRLCTAHKVLLRVKFVSAIHGDQLVVVNYKQVKPFPGFHLTGGTLDAAQRYFTVEDGAAVALMGGSLNQPP